MSWFLDRSSQNYVDKKHAFTSMPKNKFVIVPVAHRIEEEMRHSFLKEYDFRVISNGINS